MFMIRYLEVCGYSKMQGSLSEFSEDKQTGKGQGAKTLKVPGRGGGGCDCCVPVVQASWSHPLQAMEVGNAASL